MQLQNFQIEGLRSKVIKGETKPESWRRLQLKRLKSLIDENESSILKALFEDLQKPSTEAFFEIIALRQELKLTERELSSWIKPKEINVPLWLKPGEAKVIPEPLGCVLIIGAWNYPFMLALHPLISALAAGNTVVLKPSEFSPATADLIEKLFAKYFPKDIVKVFQGDGLFTQELLKEKFDHIFFTGGSKIGQKVMSAAAKYLTPVTLELGGKNPALILKDANLEVTAKRLIWGKCLNSGQTCLAPNHLLIDKNIKNQLVKKMTSYITEFYGEDPSQSSDIGSINKRQFQKVVSLIENANKESKILFGGQINLSERKIAPTLIEVEDINESIMIEEIFAPILPILAISSLENGLDIIRKQPKPLAIYLFGGNNQDHQEVLNQTSSGGVCINDVVIQAGIPDLPFGGIGLSGIGQYHGKAGFLTFSHQRSILQRPFWLDLNFRYPPYKLDISFLSKLMK